MGPAELVAFYQIPDLRLYSKIVFFFLMFVHNIVTRVAVDNTRPNIINKFTTRVSNVNFLKLISICIFIMKIKLRRERKSYDYNNNTYKTYLICLTTAKLLSPCNGFACVHTQQQVIFRCLFKCRLFFFFFAVVNSMYTK